MWDCSAVPPPFPPGDESFPNQRVPGGNPGCSDPSPERSSPTGIITSYRPLCSPPRLPKTRDNWEREQKAPGGIATPLVYGQLLALYLLHNDMNNARYLWKRIPPAIKSANAELGAVWSVGQRIWQRDFPGIYTAISAHQWSETIQPIMEALRDATRRRAFGLVSQAYTSIVADDFAAFVGLPVEEAVKGVLEQGWQADFATRMVMPKKPGVLEASFNRFIPSSEPVPVPPIPNEQQLARLTDYVAFLEN
uniref:COP9 signalosome complex subunit 8 n=1 Tax=Catharus ustulatus TaxID=91951 RepID=A0A8C3U6H7_CATUS